MNLDNLDPIKFYEGKNILITGATGFVGKVLLEKFMRSIPNTGKIYLMVREKKKQSLSQRLDKIFDSYCFSNLKKQYEDNASFK